MLKAILPVRSLLIAIFTLMAGSGFMNTLLSVRLERAGSSALLIGLVGTSYFAGLVLGSVRAPAVVRRVGHIRAFAAFVAAISASTLIYALHRDVLLWAALRFGDGFCLAGVYVCLESWLNERADAETRGSVLAGYMIALYSGQAVGQFLLSLGDTRPAVPLLAASILISLASIPVVLTTIAAPPPDEGAALPFRDLYKVSPLGIVGVLLTGVMLGAFYGLGAVYVRRLGLNLSGTALFMSVVIMGGVALQWPLGRLSDRLDRRKVIVLSFAGALLASFGIALLGRPGAALLGLGALFGGLSFALYPLCVAHTNDHLEPHQRVAASSGLCPALFARRRDGAIRGRAGDGDRRTGRTVFLHRTVCRRCALLRHLAPDTVAARARSYAGDVRNPAPHDPHVRIARPRRSGRRPECTSERLMNTPRNIGAEVASGHPETTPPSVLHRPIAASAIGNATEWFDYGIYAYGVSYISAALFPGETGEATLFALATFAISFLVRPLGGFFWGPLGDRYGRKAVLGITIIMMAAATVGVGLIPSFAAIGFWAPCLLVILRMIQGFSTGEEYGGAAIFMAEYAPDARRGFYGSFLEVGTLAGFSAGALLMLGFSLLLGDQAMYDWAWRLPFLLAGPLGLVGIYLRSRMAETPLFREVAEQHSQEPSAKVELRHLWSHYRRPLLAMSGLVIALNVVNYTLLSYMPTYLQRRLGLSTDASLMVPIAGMLFMMVMLPLAGALSDRIGRKPLWYASLIGLLVSVVPLYHFMGSDATSAAIGFAVLGLLYMPQLATISATFPAFFPTTARFAGFAVAYNVSTSLFGGTAPAVNSWLIDLTGDPLMPAYLMMASCLVGLVALRYTEESAGKPLRQIGEPHPTVG
jgi:Sugar phosphate permease